MQWMVSDTTLLQLQARQAKDSTGKEEQTKSDHSYGKKEKPKSGADVPLPLLHFVK